VNTKQPIINGLKHEILHDNDRSFEFPSKFCARAVIRNLHHVGMRTAEDQVEITAAAQNNSD
jgi:hypothetical protein